MHIRALNIGSKMRSLAGLPTLRARRETLCDKSAAKCLSNPCFCHWFLLKAARSKGRTKNQELYKEEKAGCNRLFNSPLFYLRRRLNGKIGNKLRPEVCQVQEGVISFPCFSLSLFPMRRFFSYFLSKNDMTNVRITLKPI